MRADETHGNILHFANTYFRDRITRGCWVIRLYRGQRLVFSTTLYTYMTRAYVNDLRSIIEQDMREAGICTDLYDLTKVDRNGEETITTFTAVYCDIAINQPINYFLKRLASAEYEAFFFTGCGFSVFDRIQMSIQEYEYGNHPF